MGQGSTGNVICAVASFFCPGLGQLLQGRIGAAFWHFILTAILAWFLIGFLVWIYSIYDAAVFVPNR
ncbi:MAG: hypothetical protein P1V97_17505 [Planctomycetota bacterium]|nr:hypothetical protein [Planctomycetota bacterium]